MDFTSVAGVQAYGRTKGISDAYVLCLFSQAILETGHFTSNVYNNARNAFGMRIASGRDQGNTGTYTSPTNGDFALYPDVEASFNDRIALDIQNGVSFPVTQGDIEVYLRSVLDHNYVPSSERGNYYSSWMSILYTTYQANNSMLNITGTELTEISSDDYGQTPMTFAGLGQKTILAVVMAIVSYYVVKWWKNRKK